MKINKKEKFLLSLFGIVFVGFLYYEFGYSYLEKVVDQKTAEKQEIETKYNKAMDTIKAMDGQKSKVKMTNAKIEEEASPLYPTISQDHIILEIDKLLKDSGLVGGMEFDLAELNPVGQFKKSDKDKGDLESTMQETADKYNDKYGKKDDKEQKNSSDADKTDSQAKANDANNTSQPSSSDKKDNKDSNDEKIVFMKGKVKFYGTYESVVKFVKAVGNYDRKICLYGIGMDINDPQWVKGEMGISIFSIPKINNDDNDEMSKYLEWKLNNAYGKKEPFQTNQTAGSGIEYDKPASDFMVSVKQPDSDLPTATIGKSNDPLRNTYVYADGNNIQQAEIVLTQEGDKYYYKYKTGNGSMPVKYDGPGCEFTPYGDSISISILSEIRTGSSDKAGLKLKVVNNTNKLIKVDITGDDSDNPRVSIDGDSKNVSVSQK